MKAEYTKIIKVTSDEHSVDISYIPRGGESPVTISITPHDYYTYLNYAGLTANNIGRVVPNEKSGGNQIFVDLVPE